MKKCYKCEEVKPHAEFYKNKAQHDGLYPLCRQCTKAKNDAYSRAKGKPVRKMIGKSKAQYATESKRQAVERNRDYIINYLSTHPCVDCGNTDYRILEFDHRPGTEKVKGCCQASKQWNEFKNH